jgi:hypothetical protein
MQKIERFFIRITRDYLRLIDLIAQMHTYFIPKFSMLVFYARPNTRTLAAGA